MYAGKEDRESPQKIANEASGEGLSLLLRPCTFVAHGRIVAELRREQGRIESAITALLGNSAPAGRGRPPAKTAAKATGRGKGMSDAGRKRISEMMKKRWAERRKRSA